MTNFWDPALTQKRALINQQAGIGSADNAWQTKSIGAQHRTAYLGLKQQYATQRANLPGQYAGRGLLDSGIYKQGLIDFNKQRTNSFQGLAQQYAQQQHGLQQSGAMNTMQQNQGLNDVDLAEAQGRAQIAAQLRAVS